MHLVKIQHKIPKNEAGFIETIIIMFIILIIGAIYGLIHHSHIKTDKNGYKDTYACRAFHNYATTAFTLPPDFKLKERAYAQCGDFFTLPASGETQNVELGYQSSKQFQNISSAEDYVTTWLEKHNWHYDDSSTLDPLFPYLNYTNLNVSIVWLAYNPAMIEVNISSPESVSYKSYPKTSKSSPPQITLNTNQQINDAPFGLYVPTVSSDLKPIPVQANLVKTSGQYLRFNYSANGVSLSYSSPQVASNPCSTIYNSKTDNCVIWATTPKGYKIYTSPCTVCVAHDPDILSDGDAAYVEINNTLMGLSGTLNTMLTKSEVIGIVDSLQKIN